MSLLVVLPFFYGDEHLLLKNLEWMRELDGHLDYDCLLACDTATNPDTAKELASALFNKVSVETYKRVERNAWPWPQNNAFVKTAWNVMRIHRGPWIWVETDSIPMKRGWLHSLSIEYNMGRKPFGGHLSKEGIFNGVAIYPNNISRFSQKIMMSAMTECKNSKGEIHQIPWDVYGSQEVKRSLHVMNRLMQHMWNDDATQKAYTFPDQKSLEVIRPEVVLFHRCKDGTLIDRLRERMSPPVEQPPPIEKKVDDAKLIAMRERMAHARQSRGKKK